MPARVKCEVTGRVVSADKRTFLRQVAVVIDSDKRILGRARIGDGGLVSVRFETSENGSSYHLIAPYKQ